MRSAIEFFSSVSKVSQLLLILQLGLDNSLEQSVKDFHLILHAELPSPLQCFETANMSRHCHVWRMCPDFKGILLMHLFTVVTSVFLTGDGFSKVLQAAAPSITM